MFFRNLFLFRFAVPCAVKDASALDERLREHELRPCGQLELSTSGFVDPLVSDNIGDFIVDHGDIAIFCLGTEARLLPNDVINRAVAKRIREREEFEEMKVGPKQRRHIKDEVVTQMLPQSFVRLTRTHAMINFKTGWLVIDTSSQKRAEDVVRHLRNALGTFPCVPMCPEESPRALFTDWVIRGKLPAGLALADSVVLRDPVENGACVRCQHQDLATDEVREHLMAGKRVFEIALSYNDRISFTLNESLVVRKFRMLDGALDEIEETERELYETASFLLMAAEITSLVEWMAKTFGLSVAPALKLDGGDAPASMRNAEHPAVQKAAAKFISTVRKGRSSVTISTPGNGSAVHISKDNVGSVDELFTKALDFVRKENKVSISSVQRKLKIGYNRAAQIVEQLEQHGHVSAPGHNGARTVTK